MCWNSTPSVAILLWNVIAYNCTMLTKHLCVPERALILGTFIFAVSNICNETKFHFFLSKCVFFWFFFLGNFETTRVVVMFAQRYRLLMHCFYFIRCQNHFRCFFFLLFSFNSRNPFLWLMSKMTWTGTHQDSMAWGHTAAQDKHTRTTWWTAPENTAEISARTVDFINQPGATGGLLGATVTGSRDGTLTRHAEALFNLFLFHIFYFPAIKTSTSLSKTFFSVLFT